MIACFDDCCVCVCVCICVCLCACVSVCLCVGRACTRSLARVASVLEPGGSVHKLLSKPTTTTRTGMPPGTYRYYVVTMLREATAR